MYFLLRKNIVYQTLKKLLFVLKKIYFGKFEGSVEKLVPVIYALQNETYHCLISGYKVSLHQYFSFILIINKIKNKFNKNNYK